MDSCKICKHNLAGNCRRYPPAVFPMPTQNQLSGEVQMQVITLPVQVADDNLCGEFTEKTPALTTV